MLLKTKSARLRGSKDSIASRDGGSVVDDTREIFTQSSLGMLENVLKLQKLGIYIIEPDDTIVVLNDVAEELLEFDAGFIDANPTYEQALDWLMANYDFGDALNASTPAEVVKMSRRQMSRSPDRPTKTYVTTPSGRTLCLKQMMDGDGRILSTIEDISRSYERKRALEAAMEMGNSGHYVFTYTDHEYQFSCRFLERLLDRTQIRGLRKTGLWTYLHTDDRETGRLEARRFERNRTRSDITLRFRLPGLETRWLRLLSEPVLSDNGDLSKIVTYFTDVTDLLADRAEMRRAQESLETALAAKTDFLARISHEVRTPLNGVVGIADALIHHHGDPAIRPQLDLIQTSAMDTMRILDETLDAAKAEMDGFTIEARLTQPRQLLEKITSLWQQRASADGTHLRLQIDDSLPQKCIYDPHRIEQCLNNLVSNAVKYGKGGHIDIMARIADVRDSEMILFAVRDDGPGIDEANCEKVFEPYVQLTGAAKGTGLGLSITRDLIEAMGGFVKCSSSPGKGATFALAIPLVREPKLLSHQIMTTPLVSALLDERQSRQTLTDLRILAVDDNDLNHTVVRALLNTMVKTLDFANDGRQALDRMEVAEYDVILMDIHMPVMDGIETTLAIRSSRKSYANIPIIALTADPEFQQKRVCVNIGMNAVLGKPFRLDELLGVLDELGLTGDLDLAAAS